MSMTSKLMLIAVAACLTSAALPAPAQEDFASLFDGTSLKGWKIRGENQESFQVVDGAITRVAGGSSWIYTEGRYTNFVLKLEFKIVDGGNSGVFFRVGDPADEVYTGIEMQVFGDYGEPVTKHSSGAIYDLVAASSSAIRPPEQWNEATIECNDNWIRIDLNGTRIIEMDLDRWTEPMGKFPTPYAEMPREGHIGFQNHGDWVAYRNVRIREID